jgi:N-acyl-D-aspartate/D-glutamate deacylase
MMFPLTNYIVYLKKLQPKERLGVIPYWRSFVAYRPLRFLGRALAPIADRRANGELLEWAHILSRYGREQNALPRPLAIHKMTGATACALKLKDRGLLREGFCADVVLFDPEDFVDRATYADPHQFPSGARTTVIVNGTLVVENAIHTGALPGKVLRRDASGAVG